MTKLPHLHEWIPSIMLHNQPMDSSIWLTPQCTPTLASVTLIYRIRRTLLLSTSTRTQQSTVTKLYSMLVQAVTIAIGTIPRPLGWRRAHHCLAAMPPFIPGLNPNAASVTTLATIPWATLFLNVVVISCQTNGLESFLGLPMVRIAKLRTFC